MDKKTKKWLKEKRKAVKRLWEIISTKDAMMFNGTRKTMMAYSSSLEEFIETLPDRFDFKDKAYQRLMTSALKTIFEKYNNKEVQYSFDKVDGNTVINLALMKQGKPAKFFTFYVKNKKIVVFERNVISTKSSASEHFSGKIKMQEFALDIE